MASLDISEYSLEDMFPFPSSPNDQLAIFSPLSSSEEEAEEELGVYDGQKQHKGKMGVSQGNREKRIQASGAVPSLELKKNAPTLNLADICDPKTSSFGLLSARFPLGLVPDIPRGVSAPLHVQPSSLSSSSRIKSTPPNLPLLFSLFNVLEEDEEEGEEEDVPCSPSSSSPTSPISSSSSAFSSSVTSSPAQAPRSPVTSTITLEVVPPVLQWMNPVSAGFSDRTSLLSNFADVLN